NTDSALFLSTKKGAEVGSSVELVALVRDNCRYSGANRCGQMVVLAPAGERCPNGGDDRGAVERDGGDRVQMSFSKPGSLCIAADLGLECSHAPPLQLLSLSQT